jgi:hypothetical protein
MADSPNPWGLNADPALILEDHKQALYPYIPIKVWHQIVRHSDFTTVGVEQALDLNATFTTNTFPTNVIVIGGYGRLFEVFAGGTISACTVELGDAGNDNEIITATDVFTGASLARQLGLNINTQEAAYTPLLTMTATAGNLSTTESGIYGVYILYIDLPDQVQANTIGG